MTLTDYWDIIEVHRGSTSRHIIIESESFRTYGEALNATKEVMDKLTNDSRQNIDFEYDITNEAGGFPKVRLEIHLRYYYQIQEVIDKLEEEQK